MSKITALFWDIGGVILTNGWDRHSRREAAEKFHLDWEEFQDRHDFSFPGFDSGHMTLNEYLDRTLFYRPRPFSREEFVEFMYAQSKEYAEVRAVLDQVTKSGKYLITSINNEPLELNSIGSKNSICGEISWRFSARAMCGRGNRRKQSSGWRSKLRNVLPASASLSMTVR